MPREVELKYRCAEPEEVLRRLESLGARHVGDYHQEDIYFQHPCRDFASSDEALRVRISEEGVELTYKGPRGQLPGGKSREELIVPVGNLECLLELLKRLGFQEIARVRKRRRVFLVEGAEVSLDYVEGLGAFVELEDKGAGTENLRKIAETLRLGGSPLEETYLEMLLRTSARAI
jgi:adenylyl cyclase CyaB, putative|uniref:Class IV adenylate cyclase n=1 Tax=Thermofilum pendens TaxID=2269 RepID=A0A7C3SNL2_THEPE